MDDELWVLPGPRRFLRDIGDHLERGRSVVCTTPATCPPSLHDAVRATIDPRSRRTIPIAAREIIDSGLPPTDALFELFALARSSGDLVDVADLVANDELRGTVLWLDLRGDNDAALATMARFLGGFARAAERLERATRPLIVVLWPGERTVAMPPAEPALAHIWWWGRIGPLDTAVWLDGRAGETYLDPCFTAAIEEVAAFDLELADVLLSEWRGDFSALVTIVSEYGKHRGLGADNQATSALTAGPTGVTIVPPFELRPAWGSGSVERWGQQVVAHTVLGGDPNYRGLRERVWRAQVRQLFPVLETERQRVATWVGERRTFLDGELAGVADVLALELGPLAKLVFESQRLRCTSTRLSLVRWLSRTRNALAHLEPLEMEAIEEGRRLMAADCR